MAAVRIPQWKTLGRQHAILGSMSESEQMYTYPSITQQ